MTRRDWRAGELRLLAVALVIAVAAVTSVGFFVDRIRLGLHRDAAQFLGADVVIESDRPIGDAPAVAARERGLSVASTVAFPSMAIADAPPQANTLVAVKAVSPGYPLRGRLSLLSGTGAVPTDAIPAPGSAWVDPQVLGLLGVQPGARLRLGDATLRIDGVIAVEPDRGGQLVGFAPRVMINLSDLAGTGLIQPASRVGYRLLAAGEPRAAAEFAAWERARLQRGQRLESLDDGRPDVRRTLDRAERFLALVAMLAALVAAVAVATAARRFSQRHLDSCAMMRCLGLPQRDIFRLFGLEFVVVGLAACAFGVGAGFGLHFVLLQLLAGLLHTVLPMPSPLPALQGLVCGLVLLLGFALPPLEQLRHVPPLHVLRREIGPPGAGAALGYLAGAAGFALLLLWAADDLKIGALTAGGFALGVALFAAAALGLLRLLEPVRARAGTRIGMSWRFALAGLARRRVATAVQVVALAVGIMALLILAMARTDLIGQWRQQAPPEAPNRFVINIQPDQADAVTAYLRQAGIPDTALWPMIRGRLVAIDGRPIGPESYADERARGLVEREFNLSYASEPPSYNTIVAGSWFAPGAQELSIEEGIAKRLGIRLGDSLRFDVAGEPVEARVTSMRKLSWDSMKVNFFVIMSPRLLRAMPQSYITSFFVPPGRDRLTADLVREFPNLTVIDTEVMLRQVRAVLDQVIAAVQFLFAFTLAAGVLVLYAALAGSHDERSREAGLLRALGASRQQLARAQTAEMICLGGLAGLLAAIGAAAVGWALARYAFEFEFAARAWVFVVGVAAGVACALAGGWLGLRRILNTPPLASLREAPLQ
jgi:putative ABC transport system permease protein